MTEKTGPLPRCFGRRGGVTPEEQGRLVKYLGWWPNLTAQRQAFRPDKGQQLLQTQLLWQFWVIVAVAVAVAAEPGVAEPLLPKQNQPPAAQGLLAAQPSLLPLGRKKLPKQLQRTRSPKAAGRAEPKKRGRKEQAAAEVEEGAPATPGSSERDESGTSSSGSSDSDSSSGSGSDSSWKRKQGHGEACSDSTHPVFSAHCLEAKLGNQGDCSKQFFCLTGAELYLFIYVVGKNRLHFKL